MGASLTWSSTQATNLLLAWSGAIAILVYRVACGGLVHWMPLALLPRNLVLVAAALTAACIVAILSRGTRSLWVTRSLCCALGLSSASFTILLVS